MVKVEKGVTESRKAARMLALDMHSEVVNMLVSAYACTIRMRIDKVNHEERNSKKTINAGKPRDHWRMPAEWRGGVKNIIKFREPENMARRRSQMSCKRMPAIGALMQRRYR